MVVGVDNSPEALVASRYALRAAAARQLVLRLVHAYRIPHMDTSVPGASIVQLSQAAEDVLNHAVSRLDLPPGLTVETVLKNREPAVLLEEQSLDARLVVIGQHHFNWSEHDPVGTIASQLAARAACPVVAVPRGWVEAARPGGPVVVALDAKNPAEPLLRAAFEEAELTGRQVIVLHAMARDSHPAEIERHRGELADELAGWVAAHPGTAVRIMPVPGEPVAALREVSRDAAVLVVGRPHHRGLTSRLRSVARSVLKGTACPVIIVPSDGTPQIPSPVGAKPRSVSTS
ncbi:universal stress protein [Microlunatus panaciterrae]